MPRAKTTRIHVNQFVIRSNKKKGTNEPAIGVIQGKTKRYAHQVEILGYSKLIYSPDKPLPCGARLWIETQSEVVLY